MKAVIMAGGLPSIVEDRYNPIPKPMAEIGGEPMLYHIMKNYSCQGLDEFIICAGYKVDYIKNYFMNYYLYQSDITVDLGTNEVKVHKKETETWKVTVADTGKESSIAQRLLRIREFVGQEDFLVTYGDCVSDIDINKLAEQHRQGKKAVTMAVATPTGRRRVLPITEEGKLSEREPDSHQFVRADACTMMFSSEIFPYLEEFCQDDVMSDEFMKRLAHDNQISLYFHEGFWSPMETARDKNYLERLYAMGKAPWKNWGAERGGNYHV